MAATPWLDKDTIRFLLADLDTWAVVGLSGDPSRTAYRIAEFLQNRGKRIVPIHPDAPVVHGEQGYATLADVPFPIDCVDVFRRSEAAGRFADEAVAIGARGVWFQLGVIDEDAYRRTTAAGVPMVMDTCPAVPREPTRRHHRGPARRSCRGPLPLARGSRLLGDQGVGV
jgi:predicted CoA-binding protein